MKHNKTKQQLRNLGSFTVVKCTVSTCTTSIDVCLFLEKQEPTQTRIVESQYIQQTTKPPLCIHTEIGPLSVLCNTQGPLIKVKLSVQDRLASIVFNHVVGEIRNSLFNFPFSENAMCYIIGQIWNYKRQDKVYFFLTTYLCNKRYIRIR